MTEIRPRQFATGVAQLRVFLESFATIPNEEWDFARRFLTGRVFSRGEHLQRAGRPVTRLYYVLDGIIRNYLLNGDGTERATALLGPGDLAGDYNAGVVTGRPGSIHIDALRVTSVVVFPTEMLPMLYDRHSSWNRIGRAIAEASNVRREEESYRFRTLSASEHYEYLVENKGRIAERVPLYHVASYLGIRAETLSRIRRDARGTLPPKTFEY